MTIEADVPIARSLPTPPADRAVAPLAAPPGSLPPLGAAGGGLGGDAGCERGSAHGSDQAADPGFDPGSEQGAEAGPDVRTAGDAGTRAGAGAGPGAGPAAPAVVLAAAVPALGARLARYGLALAPVARDAPIPGSYWGDSEAGLIGSRLYVRDDTPLHSALHEACHFVCMDADRRAGLHTDAGGDYAEECGVCLLQVLLADALPGVGRARICADMDAWGYSFRLGSTAAWLAADADDARDWLHGHGLIDAAGRPTFRLRT